MKISHLNLCSHCKKLLHSTKITVIVAFTNEVESVYVMSSTSGDQFLYNVDINTNESLISYSEDEKFLV